MCMFFILKNFAHFKKNLPCQQHCKLINLIVKFSWLQLHRLLIPKGVTVIRHNDVISVMLIRLY